MEIFMGVALAIFISLLLPMAIVVWWPKIYRWAFFPKREPDFKYQLYMYWFDEKVAYSELMNKKKLKFYEWNGVLYRDEGPFNHASKLRLKETHSLAHEVQEAYKQHIHVKFEEIFLND